jgi:hypothetical protein
MDVDHVTWLYGPSAEALAATAVVSIGVALEIAREPGDDNKVHVGTRGHATTAWHPLDDCRLEPDGFWTPGLQEAIEARQRWLSDRAARTGHGPRRIKPVPTIAEQSASKKAPPAPSSTVASRSIPDTDSRSFRFQSALHPEAEAWTPAIGWEWLSTLPDDQLRQPAKLMAYLVQRIYLNGPTERLGFPDLHDPEQHIERCLAAAGLIDINDVRGICRWRRTS